MSKLIGTGGFGCVYYPSLKCKEPQPDSFYENKISKLITNSDAKSELKQYTIIDNLDKNNLYHLGKPVSCQVDYKQNKELIDQCDLQKIINQKKKLTLLVEKNGGYDLYKLFFVIEPKDFIRIIPSFFTNFKGMFSVVEIMIKNKYSHRDLRPENIVYSLQTGKFNLIDFGLFRHMNTIIYSEHMFNLPFEYSFLSELSFKKIKEKKKPYCQNRLNQQLQILYNYCFIPELDPFFHIKIYEGLKSTISSIQENKITYDEFRSKSLNTFDVYGLGFTLLYILKKTHSYINPFFCKELYHFAFSMINSNLESRITIDMAISKYDQIINTYFVTPPFQKSFSVSSKKSIHSSINKTAKTICNKKDNKELNPFTGRYNKTCKKGYHRNSKFKCVSNKKTNNIK